MTKMSSLVFLAVAVVILSFQTTTVATAAPPMEQGIADILEPLGDNLLRVWHFDPANQDEDPDRGWFLYDPRPAFIAGANTLHEKNTKP